MSDTPKTDALRRGHPLVVKSSWAGEILESHEMLEKYIVVLRECNAQLVASEQSIRNEANRLRKYAPKTNPTVP
jgi:hypothetical protein